MLRLSLEPRQSAWLDLVDGVRVKVKPYGSSVRMAADSMVRATLGEDSPPGVRRVEAVKALAELAIEEWEGVGDEAGAPLPVTPEAVRALMELTGPYQAFELLYFGAGIALEQEKNASALTPNGGSAAGETTAPPAPPQDQMANPDPSAPSAPDA
jgi:hypothetical protein